VLKKLEKTLGADGFDMIKGAVVSLGTKGTAAAIGFLFSALIARKFGAEGVGLYGVALTGTVILLTIAGLGIDNAVLRRTSIAIHKGDFKLFSEYAVTGSVIVVFSAALLSFVEYHGAGLLSTVISGDESAAPLIRVFAYAVVPMSLIKVLSACLKAQRRIVLAQIVDGMIVPTIGIVFILLYSHQADIELVVQGYAVGTALAATLGFIGIYRALPYLKTIGKQLAHVKELTKIGIPTLGVVLGSYLTEWVCIFTVARFASIEDVGFLRSCWQITFLLPFVTSATDSILSPRVASMYDAGQYEDLAKLIRLALAGIFACVLPVVVILVFAGEYVLMIFGDEFTVAAPILAILALGQLVNSTLGLSGKILFLTGFERKSFKNSMVGAALIVIFAIILVPEYGALGAAMAAAITQVIRCVSATIIVAQVTGMNIVTGSFRHKETQ